MPTAIVNKANFSLQEEFLSSAELYEDREATHQAGCLSVLLWPPFSALLFGALLFCGLTKISFSTTSILNSLPAQASNSLAPLFTPQVQRWAPQIMAWAAEHDLDPNLVATVMQIESCGDPGALSRAGAMGLFQVMPYHFAEGEDAFQPNTNALRGLNYLKRSLENFENNPSLALAGYNGGVNGASRPASQWAQETIDYQYWGENIYADAAEGLNSSPILQEWLTAGGASLCAQAEQRVAQTP